MFREWSLSLSRRWPPAARHDRGRDVRGSHRARRDRSWLGIICKDFGSLATHGHVGVHCLRKSIKEVMDIEPIVFGAFALYP